MTPASSGGLSMTNHPPEESDSNGVDDLCPFHKRGFNRDSVSWPRGDSDKTILAAQRRCPASNRDVTFAFELLIRARIIDAGRQMANVDVSEAASRHVHRAWHTGGIGHPGDTNCPQISAEVM